MFTEDEFKSVVTIKGRAERKASERITQHYNRDAFNPKDGELIRATDHLAAFIEAYLALKNGVMNQELTEASNSIKRRYQGKVIGGIRFQEIYADFD